MAGLPIRNAADKSKDTLAAFAVFIALFLLYAIPLFLSRPLVDSHELRIAIVAREMVTSGDYVIPKISGQPVLTQPPLPAWIAAVGAKVLGGGNAPSQTTLARSVELEAALATAFAAFILVLYGCAVFGRAAGVLAGLILGLSGFAVIYGERGYSDDLLLCACACSFCSAAWLVCMPRPGILSALGLGISLGLGSLAKGPIVLLLVLAGVVAEVLVRRSFSARKAGLFIVAMLVAAGIAGAWLYTLEQHQSGAVPALFTEYQNAVHTDRVSDSRWCYYFGTFALLMLPWTPLLVCAWAIFAFARKEPSEQPGAAALAGQQLRFLIFILILGFAGFYAAPAQQAYFLLPLLPALSLASGAALGRFKIPGGVAEEKLAWTQILSGIFGGLAVMLLPLAPQILGANSHLVKLLPSNLGWNISVPLGLAVVLLHFFCSRKWAEGTPLSAGFWMAAAAYAGMIGLSMFWTARARSLLPLSSEAERLRGEITRIESELGPKVKFYAVTGNQPQSAFVFYLDRPIYTLNDLMSEKSSEDGAQRVLVGRRDELRDLKLDLEKLFPSSKEDFLALPLAKGVDWGTQLRNKLNVKTDKN